MQIGYELEIHNAWIVWTLLSLAALVLGSFLNVVITRLPIRSNAQFKIASFQALNIDPSSVPVVSLLQPAFSRCPRCHSRIRTHHLIPIVGWLLVRGRCAICSCRIPVRYLFIELLTVLIVLVSVVVAGLTWNAAALIACLATLTCLAVTDLEHGLLPDELTSALLWCGLLFIAVMPVSEFFPSLPSAVIGAIAGYGSLALINRLYRIVRGRDGMGSGDFKLLAAIGVWVGWELLPALVLLAIVLALIYGLVLVIQKQYSNTTGLPFGPFLALACATTILFRDEFVLLVLS